jgi:hypothetical protein
MRRLLLLALIFIAALFLWKRSNPPFTQWVQLLSSGGQGQAAHSSGGGPVRQWEHAPDDVMATEAALPQPQSGAAAINSVRQGLQNSGQR